MIITINYVVVMSFKSVNVLVGVHYGVIHLRQCNIAILITRLKFITP
jgi:hypothetical protein